MSDPLVFDYIVIGAGTAGALMANRLSADPQHRVLLVEAGPPDDYAWIHIPVGYLYCIGNARTDWLYQTEPDAGLNGRRLRYPRGRTLGGCSSINGMIYMRGQSRDYESWAEATGDDSWRWARVLPEFMRHEDHFRAAEPGFAAFHGRGGEWRVDRQRLRWDILDAFAAACEQVGIVRVDDFNRGDNAGVDYFHVNQKAGLRWNTARAFLRPTCLGRPNFELWTGTQASTLRFEGGSAGQPLRCIGAELVGGGERHEVRATRELILCAGSVNSPQLLQLSGIGPGGLLQHHGIPLRIDLPGVGDNLQDHLQIRAVFKIEQAPTLNVLASTLFGKARIALQYALARSGPMSMAPSQLGAFARSSPEREWPNLQYHVQPLSLDAFGEPLHRFPAFTASVCNLNPSSRGHVRIRSPRFEDAPAITTNYLSTEEDRRVAAESLRLTRRIAAQPALAKYRPVEFRPGVQYQSDEELTRLAGDIATTIFHPVGTTRMGRPGEPGAVLDSRLRLQDGRGGCVGGLRVVDAGAMPTITSGNTNSPTLMLAEKAAAWVLADHAPGVALEASRPASGPTSPTLAHATVERSGGGRP